MAVDPASAATTGGVTILLAKALLDFISSKKNNSKGNNHEDMKCLKKELGTLQVQFGRLDQKLDDFMDYTRDQFDRIFQSLDKK